MKTSSRRTKSNGSDPHTTSLKYGLIGTVVIALSIVGLFFWSNNFSTPLVIVWTVIMVIGAFFLVGIFICLKCSEK